MLLPLPDSPMRAVTCPLSHRRDTSETSLRRGALPLTDMESPSIARAGSSLSLPASSNTTGCATTATSFDRDVPKAWRHGRGELQAGHVAAAGVDVQEL